MSTPTSTQRPAEARWPVTVATLAVLALFRSLPEHLILGPSWIVIGLALLLFVPAVIAHYAGRVHLNTILGTAVLVVITVSEVASLCLLLQGIPGKRQAPGDLMRSSVALWLSNVLICACWYWRLDAGGPHKRYLRDVHDEGAFLFPQMTLPPELKDLAGDWKPSFIDYLFIAFNTSTAFSPTDTPVLSRWAKSVSMLQATVSLATIAILAARAISLL